MIRKDIEVNLKVLSRVEVMNALRSWVIRQMKEVVSGASANCERQCYPAWVLVTTTAQCSHDSKRKQKCSFLY